VNAGACKWIASGVVMGLALAMPAHVYADDPVATLNSSITNSDPTQTGRLTHGGTTSTCGTPNVTGAADAVAHHYKAFPIQSRLNETACLTLSLNAPGACQNGIQSALYAPSFNPAGITDNEFTAEASTPAPTDSYQANVTAGQSLTLTVNENIPDAGCPAFMVTITSARPWATARPQVRQGGSDASGQRIESGSILTAQQAAWTATVSDTYHWQSCDGSGNACTGIAGATGSTFTPDPTLIGRTLRVVDTATDVSGTSSSTSPATGQVTPPQHTLSVAKSGSGSGVVTSSPAGIHCGSACSAQVDAGTVVTLTATPAAGSSFAGWGGACSGTGACKVTMDADHDVSASFKASPPNTRISKAKIDQADNSATFDFKRLGGLKAASGFQCALLNRKGAAPRFKACTSPKKYKHLKPRRYVFEVRAFNAAGKDRTPAKKKFRID
jgi:Divergent InlB B-repeat domain